MTGKRVRELAANPLFISGIYNYCDRWCERCSLSNRCLNYAMEKERDDRDPGSRDAANEKFWQKLRATFQETVDQVREDAHARGIDLNDPELRADVKLKERAQRRRAAKHQPLARAAMAYGKAVNEWMDEAKPLFEGKIAELRKEVELAIGDPKAEVEKLSDFTDVIRWYQHFIYVKLCRAIDSRAGEEIETDEKMKRRDSDGSAKIALIAIDRSIAAWTNLRSALGGEESDTVLDLLAQLTALRRETETLFPAARSFVRPGFDEVGK